MEEKGEEASSKKHALLVNEKNLANVIFSWSFDDICNGDFYKEKVGKIPNSFESVEHYRSSFVYPLLEEVRSDICSKMGSISFAPCSKVILLQQSKQFKPHYDIFVENWKHNSDSVEKEPYMTKPGDIIAFTEATPGQYLDIKSLGRSWNAGYVTRVLGYNHMSPHFEVRTSKELVWEQDVMKKSLYAVFVTNVTTNNRIWKVLRLNQNLDVIKECLGNKSMVKECCKLCPPEMKKILEDKICLPLSLNKSQREAIVECIFKIQCDHRSSLELVWGPPGTGKTRTLTVMLWSLLRLKCRTLMCCPTNVAIWEVASRVIKLAKDDCTFLCGLGDMLLYGNVDQKAYVNEEICLNYRVGKLFEFLAEETGWRHCITAMIELLEDCVSKYKNYCDKKSVKHGHEYVNHPDSFLNFIRDSFIAAASSIRNCISTIYTHFPKTFIGKHNFEDMAALMTLLDSLESFLFQTNLIGEELKDACLLEGNSESPTHIDTNILQFLHVRRECIRFLRTLMNALDGLHLPKCNKDSIEEFCYRMASLIFCTASTSYKLHSVTIYPTKLLVIDEAAQLKECELLIPLQVPRINHAVLFGDECQLPAFVSSKVSAEAGIGRSLFQRLSALGVSRNLLDIQYRMHPSISRFPNAKFYQNRIMDAEIVISNIYEKRYIPGPMFGTYSFLNISCGREDNSDGHSLKNMLEIAVLLKIIQLLYRACEASKVKVTIGVISPYSAQVSEVQRRLGKKYDDHENFKVHVRSIDGFQGGEADIIIISTVRSNERGSIGFTSSPQRINVALTRARHCLWILGNEETLSKSDSYWEQLVLDAKVRQCFFNADDDKDLQMVILEVKKELNQLGDMLKADSMFFRNAKWKLMFSGSFTKSFKKLEMETQNLVLLFLSKLANGWRPKRVNSVVSSENSTKKMLKQYKIGTYYILCSVDISKELWDLEVPMTWAASDNIVQYKSLLNTETGESSNTEDLDERCLENSKVRESLLLMKFYSLSCGAISNLLSGCDGESLGIPFELTDQERDIVLFNRSSFILGRSGTGKTTVLTMKLLRNYQLYHLASEGYHEVRTDASVNDKWRYESYDGDKGDVLRQIFVTVSPKLCYAVREQFSQLRRSVCGGESTPECNSIQRIDVIDEIMHSSEVPDSLSDLPPNLYPLIITFQKFLMMLDGTIGVSYFDRFPVVRKSTHSAMGKSRSLVLETFIRTKEVTFEKFNSLYWPHFNKDLTRKLCSLTVFTEIMSVIKGGLQATDGGTLCQQKYVSLSSNRGSTLSMEKRDNVYKIFTDYEKRKVACGDFDLADLVMDLHHRLKYKRYNGDNMDFVFIDEVQDLSIRQISLFKYICKNVDDGFAFSGDTAQTIAKGINFRFEDIRYLFYREFLGQESNESGKRNEKGKISSLFQLNYNFRTHAGVLKLAQSVISLIYHFFPYSIDFLNPETSLISGESPVLVETGSTDALRILFANTGDVNGKFSAFGAEQVILVRDDCTKKEIYYSVGKKALDVLLYNFFSSSPFENEWRVIYEYMKDNNLIGSTSFTSFPRFNPEKHGILCSELKQLYVAVTRTKQRLWICENSEEFSGPMFHYWKKLSVAQVRKMDDTFIKEMQVESSEEDWRCRGIKLFHENNYEMAMMSFERAGDTFWAKMAEASQYQAVARGREPNSEMACKYLKKAAEIFDSIGKAESAARLFTELEEFERAGFIYLNTLPEPQLEKAGECFCMAKCFRQAAKVYASGRFYLKCLSACLYGKLFDLGMQYMQEWTQSGVLDRYNVEINRILQELRQNGAVQYYEQHDYKKMMKYVESFETKDSMRNFLNDFKLKRELLNLEIKWGNFQDAARIAKQLGDCLLEANLLSKCGVFQEASLVMLWYVFSNLTGTSRGKRSLPYQLKNKDDILEKAMTTAKSHSDSFYNFVCIEAVILSELNSIEETPESGLRFVRHWRLNVPVGLVNTSSEIDQSEQDLLEKCARRCYDLNDSETMMKFVEDFQSTDLMRNFLKTLNCLDQLILLEEKHGNLLEAAKIAELKGDVRWESDLLLKAGNFEEASLLIIWYVFAESSWAQGSRGWPLREFPQKQELLDKAKQSAANHSHQFYLFVCSEAKILSNAQISLSELGQYIYASPVQRSLRSEILACRRALDAHMNLLPSAYEWNGEYVNNLREHVEDKIAQNQVSVETLVFLWNYWKDDILDLIQYLYCETGHVGRYSALEEYVENFFGVRKKTCNRDNVYVIHNSEAKWVKEINSTLLSRTGDCVSIFIHDFVSAALNYLGSGLFSVGIEVLVNLKLLYTYCRNTSLSVFCQSSCLVHMFEIAKFLENHKFPNRKYFGNRTVLSYIKLSSENLYDTVFHIDCTNSLSKAMITLREREAVTSALKEAVLEPISVMKTPPTEQQMGNLVTLMLGSAKHSLHLNDNIMESIARNQLWKELIEEINWARSLSFGPKSSISDLDGVSGRVPLASCIFAVLKGFNCADWRSEQASISPSCFLYLAERLLVMVSYFQGHFFVTKSACVEWLIYEGWNANLSTSSPIPTEMPLVFGDVDNVIACQIEFLLLNNHDTLQWVRSLNHNSEYYRLLILRLIVLLCLICANSGKHFDKLFSLLDRKEIRSELPGEFCEAVGRSNSYFIDALARAFVRIKNPLKKLGSNDLVSELFPGMCDTITPDDSEGDLGRPYNLFWELIIELVALDKVTGSLMQFMSTAPIIKVEVEKISNLLSHTIAFSPVAIGSKNDQDLLMEAKSMVDELNQLSYALDIRNLCEENIQTVVKISKGLQSRRPKMEPFLENLFMRKHSMYT
ncbi:uncharacterized protein LOC141660706 [Apium graveolens]|uniref:uncharacterized protein LOC141660706 n=1 Tax=Apium graveolens TaxID=4045 RepID=UPI003D7A40CA